MQLDTQTEAADGESKNRIAALTDGLYGVAMTLLVIDLKLPERLELRDSGDLAQAMIALEPKFTTWATSFFVLVLFYMGNVRSMRVLRALDGPLVALYVMQLALVSLMPFSTALVGEYHPVLLSQAIYSLNMAGLALLALMVSRRIVRQPSLLRVPLNPGAIRAARFRMTSVLITSVAAIPIAMVWPGRGQFVLLFLLLAIPLSKRLERVA